MIMNNHNHTLQTSTWRHKEASQNTNIYKIQENNQCKATSSFFPIKLIAKPEMTLSTTKKDQTQKTKNKNKQTKEATPNDESTTTEPPL